MTQQAQQNAEREITESDLAHFTGTETIWKQPDAAFQTLEYTDGIRYLLSNGAAWLITDIIALQHHDNIKPLSFQCWKLVITVTPFGVRSAVLTCTDGNDSVAYSNKYEYTDFPLDELKMFCVNRILMLSSEY